MFAPILLCNATKQEYGAILTSQHKKSSVAALTLAAVGIVYGDIGTSPLYTLKVIFDHEHGLALNSFNLLGVLSLIFWGLTLIVSLKYVTLVLRADNRGEGGIMALMALALNSVTKHSRWYFPLMALGVFGATMFYGDSVITPAISVLSAIEGLEVAAPGMKPYVVYITIAVLVGLYSLQRRGTAGIGRWFGPVMTVWFLTLAVMGAINIVAAPEILAALNPLYALRFMLENRYTALVALGGVALPLLFGMAPRHSMPTWATSAKSRSARPGSWWPSPHWRSTIWARARSCSAIRRRCPTPSLTSWAAGVFTRWWCSRPWRP